MYSTLMEVKLHCTHSSIFPFRSENNSQKEQHDVSNNDGVKAEPDLLRDHLQVLAQLEHFTAELLRSMQATSSEREQLFQSDTAFLPLLLHHQTLSSAFYSSYKPVIL